LGVGGCSAGKGADEGYVFVLGFRYGRDERLTEAYAPDIWVDYY